MKYAIVFLLSPAACLAGCLSPQEAKQARKKRDTNRIADVSYIRDTKPEPDICYAAMYLGTTYGVLTTVPCESVEQLIGK